MNKDIGTSVAKNTTVMLGAQAITWLSGFVLLMFLPRYLGSADYGRLYLAISIAMILSIIIDFGGKYLIPKEVSRSKDKTPDILTGYIGVRTVIWFICISLLMFFSYAVDYSSVVIILIIILGISKLGQGAVNAITGCFQGYEMMEYPSIGVIAQRMFVSAAAVSALLLGAGPVTVAVIMAAGVIVNLAVCLVFMPNILDRIPRFRFNIPLNLVKESIPYFLWSVFAVIYYRVDAIMLSMFSTEQVVGWYGGAYRFFDTAMFLPSIFTTVLFPIFSKLTAEGADQLTNTFQRSLKYMIIAGIPMSILFFVFSGHIVDLFYGMEEYGPSSLLLKIFAAGILFVYIDFILGSTILATDKQKQWAVVGFAAIFLNIGLNYLAIPYSETIWGNGGIGAAVSTLLTEAFVMISAFAMLPGRYLRARDLTIPARGVASGLIMGVCIWLMQESGIYWIAQIILSLAAYLSALLAFNVITRREINFLKEFFSGRKFLSFLTTKREQL